MTSYRETFFAHHGVGPYDCVFCGELILMDEVIVHHDDEDKKNHDITNLLPIHQSCHARLHIGNLSFETRSAGQVARWASAKERAKQSERIRKAREKKYWDAGKKCELGCTCARHKYNNHGKKCEPGCRCGRHTR